MASPQSKSEPVQLPESLATRYGIDTLPANIEHAFGSDVCRTLFTDDEALRHAAETTLAGSGHRSSSSSTIPCPSVDTTRRLVLDPSAPGFQYESLGAILRTNIIRGRGVAYDSGVTQTDFNAEVHKRRLGPRNRTDCHMRKDELSRWAEHNIIYSKQKRLWESHKAEKKGSD